MALLTYSPPTKPWLDVIYQDQDIVVVNKQSGLLSVPGNKPQFYDSAMTRIQQQHKFVEPAHRLDMATSGVLLFAVTKEAEKELKRQFRERETQKSYQALVWGHIELDQGTVDLPLICDWDNRPRQQICFQNGKKAVTHYKVLARYPNNSTRVELLPVTGRSHQLRLHMLAIGHPILGDKFYSPPVTFNLTQRLCLHAEKLVIKHPISKQELELSAPIPF